MKPKIADMKNKLSVDVFWYTFTTTTTTTTTTINFINITFRLITTI